MNRVELIDRLEMLHTQDEVLTQAMEWARFTDEELEDAIILKETRDFPSKEILEQYYEKYNSLGNVDFLPFHMVDFDKLYEIGKEFLRIDSVNLNVAIREIENYIKNGGEDLEEFVDYWQYASGIMGGIYTSNKIIIFKEQCYEAILKLIINYSGNINWENWEIDEYGDRNDYYSYGAIIMNHMSWLSENLDDTKISNATMEIFYLWLELCQPMIELFELRYKPQEICE